MPSITRASVVADQGHERSSSVIGMRRKSLLLEEGVLGSHRGVRPVEQGAGGGGVDGELEAGAPDRRVVVGERGVVVGAAGLVVGDDEGAVGQLVDAVDLALEGDASARRTARW